MLSRTSSKLRLYIFVTLIGLHTTYLAIRSFLPVPDALYRISIQLIAIAIVEGFILFWVLEPGKTEDGSDPSINVRVLIFSGSNAVFASAQWLVLSHDPWLAAIRLDQRLLTILPWVITSCALAWIWMLVSDTELQRATIPHEAIERVGSWFRSSQSELFILPALIALGIVLRLINLTGYPPYYDEYNHINAAFQWLDEEKITYSRGFLTVTLPIALSYKLFGVSLLTTRLPMVALNMLSVIPLYYLGRKFNRLVGYVSVLLFIINPTILAIGQLARDYAILPFFLYSILLSFSTLLTVNRPIAVNLVSLRNILAMLVLTIALFFILFIDRTSTLQVALAIYAVFFGLLVLFVFKRTKSTGIRLLAILIVAALVIIILSSTSRSVFHLGDDGLLINFSTIPFKALAFDTYMHWSALFPQVTIIYFAFAAWYLYRSARDLRNDVNQRMVFMIVGSFFATLIYMSLFLYVGKIDLRDRYTVVLFDLFVPVVALIMLQVAGWIKKLLNDHTIIRLAVLITLLLAFFINVPAFAELYGYKGDSELPITDNLHFNSEDALRGLAAYDPAPNLLASENYLVAARLYDIDLDLTYAEDVKKIRKGTSSLSQAMTFAPQGWLLLSEDDTYALGLEGIDLTIDDKTLTFKDKYSNAYLWQWQTR